MIRFLYKIVRFTLYPIIFCANYMQNNFTNFFTPMNIGPVTAPEYSDFIKKKINKNDYVLDFGCGAGFFCNLFNNKKYLGVEINKSFVKTAKKKYANYDFKILDKNCLNGCKNKIKVVFINNVIHHLTDKQIDEMFIFFRKKLSKNIKFLIIEPEFPRSFFSLQFFLHALDIGNNIMEKNEYLNIFKKYLLIKNCQIRKFGIANMVTTNGLLK